MLFSTRADQELTLVHATHIGHTVSSQPHNGEMDWSALWHHWQEKGLNCSSFPFADTNDQAGNEARKEVSMHDTRSRTLIEKPRLVDISRLNRMEMLVGGQLG